MNHDSRIKLLTSFHSLALVVTLSLIGTLLLSQPETALAESPVVVVSKWDTDPLTGLTCNKFPYGAYDIDTYARDALDGEWFPSDPLEALKAGAVIIRSDAVYFNVHPEYTDPVAGRYCTGVTPYYFNLRTSRFLGWGPGQGADNRGITQNVPNNRVTETGGGVMLQNGAVNFYDVNPCLQNRTVTLANQNRNYKYILTNATNGVYGTNQTCVTPRSNLSINSTYYAFTPSMLNGTAPYYRSDNPTFPPFSDVVPTLGVHTSEVTPEADFRGAERYWGFIHLISAGPDNEFFNPGTFVEGTGRGDKAEYLMSFGGTHQNTIFVNGIDDNPPPVTVNVYVDGIYQFQMSWTIGGNINRQINHLLGTSRQFSAGTHAVAIEFVNDSFMSPFTPDFDRNMYLNYILIVSP